MRRPWTRSNPPPDEPDELIDFLASLADILAPKDIADVVHLLDHNEPGEALLALAWTIREQNLNHRVDVVTRLREVADGLLDSAELEIALNHRTQF